MSREQDLSFSGVWGKGKNTYDVISRGGNKLSRLVEGDGSRSSRDSTDRGEGSDSSSLSFGVLLSNLAGDRRESVDCGDAGRDGEESGLHRWVGIRGEERMRTDIFTPLVPP